MGRATLAVLLAVVGLGCDRQAPPQADTASRRTTPSGEVVGFVGRYGSHAWLGIPYARPPTGALRWRAPEPAEPWDGVRQALAFGPPCVQVASPFGGIDHAPPGTPVGQEDCLTLNVYAPRSAAAQGRRPVMVWIHGGGNVVGHGGFYDGGNLAQSRDLVVVTFNYRLGPLGWFRHASLRSEAANAADRSGNFGTLDIIQALVWVRDAIAAFGGDPGNVTIFGESAGGRNVASLLASPLAKGLFHRAIVQSGGFGSMDPMEAERFVDDPPPGHRNSSNEILVRLLSETDTARGRDAVRARLAATPAHELAAFLRGVDARRLTTLYLSEPFEGLPDVPQMFRDGAVLPGEELLDRFAQPDRAPHIPIVLGTNRDENKLFLFASPRFVRRILWILPRVIEPDFYQALAEAQSRMWKVTGADDPARVLRRTQKSVYVYRFDWDEQPTRLGADLSAMLGAAHGFEIPFVFGHFDLGSRANRVWTEENEPGRLALAEAMMSYWAEFAYTGSPGRGRDGELPAWTPWDESGPETPRTLVFDTEAGGGIRMTPDAATVEAVLSQVAQDGRLSSARQRCEVYRQLAYWGRGGYDEDAYAATPGCDAYRFDTFPWD